MMRAAKERKFWPILITTLQIMSWVSATSRPFPHEVQGQIQHSVEAGWETKESKQVFYREKMKEGLKDEEGIKWESTLGSTPPSCDYKCGGCSPCEPIQVPTTTDHLGIQYANYEPEGWKCKCGSSFYNP